MFRDGSSKSDLAIISELRIQKIIAINKNFCFHSDFVYYIQLHQVSSKSGIKTKKFYYSKAHFLNSNHSTLYWSGWSHYFYSH